MEVTHSEVGRSGDESFRSEKEVWRECVWAVVIRDLFDSKNSNKSNSFSPNDGFERQNAPELLRSILVSYKIN